MPGPVFLEGDHVTLRPTERSDLDALREWLNDPRVWRPAMDAKPTSADLAEEFFETVLTTEDDVHVTVCVDGEPVGHAALTTSEYGPTATERARSVELAYYFDPDHHGEGYGSETAELLVEYAFADWNMRRVFARAGDFNDASKALLESLGFQREGVRRQAAYYRGDYHDMVLYGLLREEWDGR